MLKAWRLVSDMHGSGGHLKILSTFLGMVFGVALLAAFLTGGYALFRHIAGVFATLQPQVATLAAIASVVAVLCAVIIAEGSKARGQREYLAVSAVDKAKLYERLLSLWSGQVKRQANGDLSMEDMELVKLEKLLALHGNAKVIAAHMKLRRSVKQDEKPGENADELLKKLLVEMRANIGRTEYTINKNDLLDLLLARH